MEPHFVGTVLSNQERSRRPVFQLDVEHTPDWRGIAERRLPRTSDGTLRASQTERDHAAFPRVHASFGPPMVAPPLRRRVVPPPPMVAPVEDGAWWRGSEAEKRASTAAGEGCCAG